MGKGKKDSGYQYLENDFFGLCHTRKIYRLPLLLYIYLRGRYCKYGSEFTWADTEIRKHLGVTQQTLRNAKNYLQERGLILYRSGVGGRYTRYTMLTSALLPVNKKRQVVKIITSSGENHHLKCRKSSLGSSGLVNNKVNNKVSISHKKRRFKRYNPSSKESLKYKEKLGQILEK